jgi:hypothetical protein
MSMTEQRSSSWLVSTVTPHINPSPNSQRVSELVKVNHYRFSAQLYLTGMVLSRRQPQVVPVGRQFLLDSWIIHLTVNSVNKRSQTKYTRPFLISLEAKRLQERRSPTIAINSSHRHLPVKLWSTLPKLRLTQEVPSPYHPLTDRGWIERPSCPNRDYSRSIYARPLYLTSSVVWRATVVVIILPEFKLVVTDNTLK